MDSNAAATMNQHHRLILQGVFLLLGVGVLVPWNAFISSKGYFESRLCGNVTGFESWFAMVYNLSSVLCLGLLITVQAVRDQLLTAAEAAETEEETHQAAERLRDPLTAEQVPVTSSTRTTDTVDPETKAHAFWLVMAPLALYLTVFLFTAFLVLLPRLSVDTFETLTLVSLAVCGMCGAIASAGIVATAGLFPADLGMNPFLWGQSLGGVAVSLANFAAACLEDPAPYWQAHCSSDGSGANATGFRNSSVVEVVMEEEEARIMLDTAYLQGNDAQTCVPYEQVDWAVFLYFFVGSLVLACCLLGYGYVDRFQRRRQRDEYETIGDIGVNGNTAEDQPSVTVVSYTDESPRIGLELNNSNLRLDESEANDRLVEEESMLVGVVAADITIPQDSEPNNDTVAVWNHVKGPATCIFLTFFVTLSLFPGWTSALNSAHQCQSHIRLSNDLYTPFGFLLFNVGDLLGRLLSARITQKPIRHLSTKLVTASILRFLFFPLLFLCVGGAREGIQIHSDLYVSIVVDVVPIAVDVWLYLLCLPNSPLYYSFIRYSLVIQFAFAISNGLLVTTAFVHAPTLLPHTTHMQERSSEILTFAVAFGLLSGSLFSFPVLNFATY